MTNPVYVEEILGDADNDICPLFDVVCVDVFDTVYDGLTVGDNVLVRELVVDAVCDTDTVDVRELDVELVCDTETVDVRELV